MLKSIHVLSLLTVCATQIQQAWTKRTVNAVEFVLPDSNKGFIGLEGKLIIPPLKKAGTYYLWPGLQPKGNEGVYQNVLDGRNGAWWMGSGWWSEDPGQ